ncbi:hypothetical protein NE237_002480 [Protea cynaroides]|uniref:Uncharacterized protein n=1 Tax=Protea cynaroides TaxID=273540 RepID=A0A9Q0KVI3_9MAGN|nr:hypothetical protein NE237_002480 [Protea cynaroides]
MKWITLVYTLSNLSSNTSIVPMAKQQWSSKHHRDHPWGFFFATSGWKTPEAAADLLFYFIAAAILDLDLVSRSALVIPIAKQKKITSVEVFKEAIKLWKERSVLSWRLRLRASNLVLPFLSRHGPARREVVLLLGRRHRSVRSEQQAENQSLL